MYKKAIYTEYTDASFTQRLPKPEWLGYLGPVLKGEVGDVLVVHLRNFASRPYSVHPHGVFYEKDSEGKTHKYHTVRFLSFSLSNIHISVTLMKQCTVEAVAVQSL